MKPIRRFFRMVLVGGSILVLTSIPVTPAHAATMTGVYVGTGDAQIRITTGLAKLKALNILELRERGQAATAYTTESMQSTGSGIFLNGSRLDRGIAFDVADFIVVHPDFNQQGVRYAWEARGD